MEASTIINKEKFNLGFISGWYMCLFHPSCGISGNMHCSHVSKVLIPFDIDLPVANSHLESSFGRGRHGNKFSSRDTYTTHEEQCDTVCILQVMGGFVIFGLLAIPCNRENIHSIFYQPCFHHRLVLNPNSVHAHRIQRNVLTLE
jgi:hypothetical protein